MRRDVVISREDLVESSEVVRWPRGIGAITLFVDDLAAARQFYGDVFGLPVTFEDDDSAVFDFGSTVINLLRTTAARELIEPAVVAPREVGSRPQLTVEAMTWMPCARSWPGAEWTC